MSGTNSTSTSIFPSITLGNNLLEISALTSLIGSTTAESLVLGNRGAAGLAWSTTSAFGLLWVIRACISGASPGWLRESMGVRTHLSDQAIGMDLRNTSKRASRVRTNISSPVGLFCNHRVPKPISRSFLGNTRNWRDVYVFDHRHTALLNSIPETGPGQFRVYSYADYTFYRLHDSRFQALVIILSLTKLVESFILWIYDGALFSLVTSIPWLYFFCAASYFELVEVILSRKPEEPEGELDIIAGQLPTSTHPGGSRKIILGASANPKTSMIWRFVWTIGALVCTTSLLLTYFILGQQSPKVVNIWVGFQVFWMLARIVIHFLSDSHDPLAYRILAERSPAHLSLEQRRRVLDLAIDIAQYQILVHPRGVVAYCDDTFNSQKLVSTFLRNSFYDTFWMDDRQAIPTDMLPVQVEVVSVVGDTLLSSAAWIAGSALSPKDLYESCIVSFASIPEKEIISVPAARVLCSISIESIPTLTRNSSPLPNLIPGGTTNNGVPMSWWYFIPCTGVWLLMKRNAGTTVLGRSQAEVLSDSQVTILLTTRNLQIGLKDVAEIKEIVKLSRSAGDLIHNVLH